MARFLIDENLSPRLAAFLRSLGHDAVAVRDVGLRGRDDAVVLAWTREHRRIIVTRDREFGEVAFWQTTGGSGVVLLRTVSQQVSAHQALLHRLHREGRLGDERLATALLIATPTESRWWI